MLPSECTASKDERYGYLSIEDGRFEVHAEAVRCAVGQCSFRRGQMVPQKLNAKIDTGAFRCSIHEPLAHALGWPVIGSVKVKNAMGRQERDLVRGEIRIGRSTYQAEFSLTDRSNLRTAMILGKDLLDRLNGEPPLPKDRGKQHPGYT